MIHWILQDVIAWVESGWDDGHYVNLLDISENKVSEIEDAKYFRYFTGWDSKLITKKSEEYKACPDNSVPLCIMPDRSLIVWLSSYDENIGCLLKVSLDETITTLTYDNSYLYPHISQDCTKFAFIDAEQDHMVITDKIKLLQLCIPVR